MAQTKNKRFREQKRAQKKPAPQPPTKSKKAAPAEEGGGKKLLIGGGVALALAAAVTTVMLVANPFAGPKAEAIKTTETVAPKSSAAPTEMTPALARMSMIKEYRATVQTEVAEQIAASCKDSKPVSATARIRGKETPITVTCKGIKLTVVNTDTKKPLESRGTPAP
jgi:hypothetical protein